MRPIFIITIFFLIISCKNIEPKAIIGSWKIPNLINNKEQNVSGKITFFDGDTLSIEFIVNKQCIKKYSGQYKIDTLSKMIHIETEKSVTSDYKILKLTSSEMELLNIKEEKPIRYIRY